MYAVYVSNGVKDDFIGRLSTVDCRMFSLMLTLASDMTQNNTELYSLYSPSDRASVCQCAPYYEIDLIRRFFFQATVAGTYTLYTHDAYA